jgi:hypothetical protein
MSLIVFFTGANTNSWWIGIAPRTDFTRASLPGFCISLDFHAGSLFAMLSTIGCSCAAVGRLMVSGIPR